MALKLEPSPVPIAQEPSVPKLALSAIFAPTIIDIRMTQMVIVVPMDEQHLTIYGLAPFYAPGLNFKFQSQKIASDCLMSHLMLICMLLIWTYILGFRIMKRTVLLPGARP